MCLAWGLPVSLFGNSLNGPHENLRLSQVGAYRGCTWGKASPALCLLQASCASLGQGSSGSQASGKVPREGGYDQQATRQSDTHLLCVTEGAALAGSCLQVCWASAPLALRHWFDLFVLGPLSA